MNNQAQKDRAIQYVEPPLPSNGDRRRLLRSFVLLAVCWTLFITGLCFWENRQAHAIALELARTDARSSYVKDHAYRRWATRHGGVYVPITGETPVNPYLAHVPERDITTPSGKKLTLMNPAYMVRQINEMAMEQHGIQGHITSLRPIRPGNSPDDWERSALQAFDGGANEVSSLEMIGIEPYVRLMRPVVTEAGCLKCHAQQGYNLGDIRGGISVSVPFKPYHTATRGQQYAISWGYGIIWVIGIAGLWLTHDRIARAMLRRKRAEAELQESEGRYRRLAENAEDLIYRYEFKPKRGFTYVSPSATTITGFTPEEHYHDPDLAFKLVHPDDRPLLEAASRGDLAPGSSLTLRWTRKDGRVIWTEQRNFAIFDADGNLIALEGIARDITERKQAEQALIDSEIKLREAQRLAHIGSWDWNARTDSIYWSPEYYHIYNLDPTAPTPNYKEHLKVYTPESIAKLDAAVKKTMQTGEPYELDLELAHPDAERRWIVARGEALRAADGVIMGLRGTAQNITERKIAEEATRRSLKEKEVMLKEIHHRVKNNMQVIYSLLNLQAKNAADTSVRAMLEESRNRVSSMSMIHERLYRSEDLAHIDFREYLRSLLAGIADTYKRQSVVFDLAMDPLALDVNVGIPCGLIINELVSNCLKHAFPGGRDGLVRLGINKNGAGNYVLFVADNGVGLPADLDFRGTATLGLQLVNVLAGQIHGTLELSRDKGTQFSITFAMNGGQVRT